MILLGMGNSETSMIDNLQNSGVFESNEILGETVHGPFMNGRHYCPSFNIELGKTNTCITGCQYEIDACYESKHKILIVEAKSQQVSSFNIRQLYYPWRTLYESMKTKKVHKEIICAFIHKRSDIIHLWKYIFTNPENINSISCIGHYMYQF
jgi:hypothetical protein